MNLYTKIAEKLTKKMITWDIIGTDKFDVYAYSFEVLISYSVYFTIFLIISLLTSSFWESLCFIIGFCSLRHFTGGFHTSSYLRCNLLSTLTHFIFIFLCKIIPDTWHVISIGCLIIYILFCVFIFAPVDHENKPFSEREYKQFRFRSRVYSSLMSVILLLSTILLPVLRLYIFSFIIGTAFAATSVWIAKTIYTVGKRKTDLHT